MDGQIQSGMPNAGASGAGGPAPIVGDGWVQLGGTAGKKIFWDELSQADQNMVLQYLYFLSPQIPMLIPPQSVVSTAQEINNIGGMGNVNVSSIAVLTEQNKHDIIMNMLDG